MLRLLHRAALVALALTIPHASTQSDQSTDSTQTQTYDYVVVGSGPGGGPLAADLARAGHSVLLLEAGSDLTSDPNYALLANAVAADNDVRSRWDFFVKHSDDPARELKYEHMVWRLANGTLFVGLNPPAGSKQLGIWYPRAAVLGGCAMHNAGFLEMPTDEYWDAVVSRTGDSSFAAGNMRRIFTDIENCHYEPRGTPGHGFNGWLDSSFGDDSWFPNSSDGAELLRTVAQLTGEKPPVSNARLDDLLHRDPNAPNLAKNNPLGIFGIAAHAVGAGLRVSPATYIRATLADAAHFPLKVELNAFMTKIEWASARPGQAPTVSGVQYLVGQSVYQADPRYDASKKPKMKRVSVGKELIIAGGAFNSPQILKVNGIGPAAELKKLNIPVVVDLPGVGKNLGDNYEGSVVSLAAKVPGNLGGSYSIYLNTSTSQGPRDIFMWAFNGAFEGFWPGFPDNLGPNATTFAFVHSGFRNQAGTVLLRSADPTVPPEINLRFFQDGGDQDLQSLFEAADFVEKVKAKLPASTGLAPFTEVHPCPGGPGPVKCTPAKTKENLKLQAYSHHASGTCAMGKSSDANAVVDSNFKVKGVKGLRVVDGSVFPRPPGAFPVLATFLISRKAAETILNGH